MGGGFGSQPLTLSRVVIDLSALLPPLITLCSFVSCWFTGSPPSLKCFQIVYSPSLSTRCSFPSYLRPSLLCRFPSLQSDPHHFFVLHLLWTPDFFFPPCFFCTVNPDQLIVLKPFSSSDCFKRFKLLTVEKTNFFKYSQLKFAIVIT